MWNQSFRLKFLVAPALALVAMNSATLAAPPDKYLIAYPFDGYVNYIQRKTEDKSADDIHTDFVNSVEGSRKSRHTTQGITEMEKLAKDRYDAHRCNLKKAFDSNKSIECYVVTGKNSKDETAINKGSMHDILSYEIFNEDKKILIKAYELYEQVLGAYVAVIGQKKKDTETVVDGIVRACGGYDANKPLMLVTPEHYVIDEAIALKELIFRRDEMDFVLIEEYRFRSLTVNSIDPETKNAALKLLGLKESFKGTGKAEAEIARRQLELRNRSLVEQHEDSDNIKEWRYADAVLSTPLMNQKLAASYAEHERLRNAALNDLISAIASIKIAQDRLCAGVISCPQKKVCSWTKEHVYEGMWIKKGAPLGELSVGHVK